MIRSLVKRSYGFFYILIGLRRFTLKLSLGRDSCISCYRTFSFNSMIVSGRLSLGEGCSVLSKSRFIGNVAIGKFSRLGRNFEAHGNVSIGRFCAVAQDCFLISTSHRMDLVALQVSFQSEIFPDLELKRSNTIVVGDNVWLGKSVIVLPGVVIGNGAVVGAGSVVTKNVEAYSVVAGNPAKFIRFRFDADQIKRIESSNWTSLHPSELVGYRDFFELKNLDFNFPSDNNEGVNY